MTRSELLEKSIRSTTEKLIDVRRETWNYAQEDVEKYELIQSILLAEQKRGEGCDVCRGETGIGGGMRIVDRMIECDSPDSWYRNSTSDEIHFCPNCGRDLTEGESV